MRDAIPLIPARTDLLEIPSSGHDLKKAAGMVGEIAERLRKLL
jgi:hypothetical protein